MKWQKAIHAISISSPEARVYIGCDSVRYKSGGKWVARYCTVVVLHHPRDGCNIFHHTETIADYGTIKQRMLTEVQYAVEAASDVIDYLGGRSMEVHLDINTDTKHKSSAAVKEAIGWVQGACGITPKLKPYSWAATHVSDHYAREKAH